MATMMMFISVTGCWAAKWVVRTILTSDMPMYKTPSVPPKMNKNFQNTPINEVAALMTIVARSIAGRSC